MFCVGWIFFWVAFFKSVDEESACLYDVNFGQSLHINLFLRIIQHAQDHVCHWQATTGSLSHLTNRRYLLQDFRESYKKRLINLTFWRTSSSFLATALQSLVKSTGCPITIPPFHLNFWTDHNFKWLWHMLIRLPYFGVIPALKI